MEIVEILHEERGKVRRKMSKLLWDLKGVEIFAERGNSIVFSIIFVVFISKRFSKTTAHKCNNLKKIVKKKINKRKKERGIQFLRSKISK